MTELTIFVDLRLLPVYIDCAYAALYKTNKDISIKFVGVLEMWQTHIKCNTNEIKDVNTDVDK